VSDETFHLQHDSRDVIRSAVRICAI